MNWGMKTDQKRDGRDRGLGGSAEKARNPCLYVSGRRYARQAPHMTLAASTVSGVRAAKCDMMSIISGTTGRVGFPGTV